MGGRGQVRGTGERSVGDRWRDRWVGQVGGREQVKGTDGDRCTYVRMVDVGTVHLLTSCTARRKLSARGQSWCSVSSAAFNSTAGVQ